MVSFKLFKGQKIRFLFKSSLVEGLSYYGIFLSVKLVMVNKYVLVMISCIAEIVFLPFINIVINKFGRVKT